MPVPSIVCIGSIMCDVMSYVPRLPKPGESLLGCRVSFGNGGKGANSAIAAARLGALPLMIGKIGNDINSRAILENFEKNNVISDFVFQTSEVPTGTAIIIIEDNGENRIVIAGGANMLLRPHEVKTAECAIKNAKVLVANFEIDVEAAKAGLVLGKKYGLKTILNAAPAIPNPQCDFYTLADIFCVNETEAEITTGITATDDNYELIISELLHRGCNTVILTLGEKGVLMATKDDPKCISIPAHKINAVDSTGAGDAFMGSLAYYLAYHSELPLKEQVKRAATYASLSVEKLGTQTSYPYRNELPNEMFI